MSGTGEVLGSSLVALSVTKDKTEARSRCKLYHSAAQALTSATPAFITFDSEEFDVGTLHDTATNNHRITIPAGGDTGVWLFTLQGQFAANATGLRGISIQNNSGATVAEMMVPSSPAGNFTILQCQVLINAPTVGNWYAGVAYQNSGGNLNLNSGAGATHFSATHLW